jgi:hypothetical protein
LNLLLRDRVARLIWLVALLLRLAFAAEVHGNDLDLSHNDQLDMVFLHRNAEKIADGDLRLTDPYLGNYTAIRTNLYGAERYDRLYGSATYVDSPGYLYFAAACEKIGRRSPYAIVLVQLLLDALGCGFVYVLARRTYGLATARVALAAAALCLECVAEAGFVLRESVIAFLVTGSVLALDEARVRGTIRSWWIAGLVFGAGWITKLSFSLFAPAIPLLVWLWTPAPRASAGARRLAAFALGASLAVLPFAARNVSLGVPPLRMSSTAMQIMANRNMAGYEGAAEHIDQKGVRAILDRSDDTLLGTWLAAVDTHPPGGYLRQLGRKTYYFWLGVDFWNNIRCSFLEKLSPILALCVVRWSLLGPWTAIGLVLALALPSRRRSTLHLVLAFLALGVAAALVGGVYTRYRMIVEPIACVFFAATIVDVASCLRELGKARFPAGLALLAAALVFGWLLRNPQRPLTKRDLAGYVVGTWSNREKARSYLLQRVAASSAPDG